MRLAIIGFGRLGKSIAKLIEQDAQIELVLRINSKNTTLLNAEAFADIDMALELSGPSYAYDNLTFLSENKIPTVCGSTGWTDQLELIEHKFRDQKTGFLYASNFSLGVNLFFALNYKLAQLTKNFNYNCSVEEIHHVHKLDKPSGTALTLVSGILEEQEKYNGWVLDQEEKGKISIKAIRTDETPGTHSVQYESLDDYIEIKHEAKGREAFAKGALMACHWLKDKNGTYSMQDLFKI